MTPEGQPHFPIKKGEECMSLGHRCWTVFFLIMHVSYGSIYYAPGMILGDFCTSFHYIIHHVI